MPYPATARQVPSNKRNTRKKRKKNGSGIYAGTNRNDTRCSSVAASTQAVIALLQLCFGIYAGCCSSVAALLRHLRRHEPKRDTRYCRTENFFSLCSHGWLSARLRNRTRLPRSSLLSPSLVFFSDSLSLSRSLSFALSLYSALSFFLSFFLSIPLSFSLFIYLSLHPSLCPSSSVCFSPCLSRSPPLLFDPPISRSLSLTLYLCVYVSIANFTVFSLSLYHESAYVAYVNVC
jgi:hypothetical protein